MTQVRLPAEDMNIPLCIWGGHSCGGCCNDFSRPRELLARAFARRARLFAAEPATGGEEALRCHHLRLDLLEGSKECKFLAFLEETEERVGCLIHPGRQGGIELRDASPFGAGLCAESLCPPAAAFDPRRVDPFLALLARGADWYDYSRLFTRFIFCGPHSGLYEVLAARTRPLAALLLGRGWRPARGLASYGRLLSRLLGLPGPRVFEAAGLARLSEVNALSAAVLARQVERLLEEE